MTERLLSSLSTCSPCIQMYLFCCLEAWKSAIGLPRLFVGTLLSSTVC